MTDITALVSGVKNVGVDGWNSLKTIATFLNYLIHPSLVIHAFWAFTQAYAFWICLILAMICTLLYAIGFRKFLKFVPCTAILFAFIKSLGAIL